MDYFIHIRGFEVVSCGCDKVITVCGVSPYANSLI